MRWCYVMPGLIKQLLAGTACCDLPLARPRRRCSKPAAASVTQWGPRSPSPRSVSPRLRAAPDYRPGRPHRPHYSGGAHDNADTVRGSESCRAAFDSAESFAGEGGLAVGGSSFSGLLGTSKRNPGYSVPAPLRLHVRQQPARPRRLLHPKCGCSAPPLPGQFGS